MTLDQAIQLHEILEIHYYVDHYAAELYTQNGDRIILIGRGESPDEALLDLKNKLLAFENLQELRQISTFSKIRK